MCTGSLQLLVCMNVTVLNDADVLLLMVLSSISLLTCVAWLLVLFLVLDGVPAAGLQRQQTQPTDHSRQCCLVECAFG